MSTYGVVGVGAIAEAMVVGLCSDGTPPRVVLSPRGHERSTRLASRFEAVEVAADNQAVVDAADVVLVCVRPQQAEQVLGDIDWRPDLPVISVMAGVSVDALRALLAPATELARAIPLPSVARRAAPTPIYPSTPAARRLFRGLGGALPVDDERAFDALSAATGTIAHHFGSLALISGWLAAQGVAAADATAYVAAMHLGLARELETGGLDLGALADDYATPGGINERFASLLREEGVLEASQRALDVLLDGLHPSVATRGGR